WEYDDARAVQRLVRLTALCPACHEVKHFGLANKRGRGERAIAHLARVNGWSVSDAEAYVEAAFEQWASRSRHEWTLDCSVLEAQGVHIAPGTPRRSAGRERGRTLVGEKIR